MRSGPSPNASQSQTEHEHKTTNTWLQLFGLLYTLSRERWDFNKRWVVARLALEHLQLIAFVLQPIFLWALPNDHWWAGVT